MSYISTEYARDILVIGFPSTTILDSVAIRSISDEMIAAVEDFDCRRLVLDFTGVDFITSEWIGSLVQFRRFCQVRAISLKLASLSDSFLQALKLTKLATHFKTYGSRISAMEMFEADDFVARHNFFTEYANEGREFAVSAPTLIAPSRLTYEESHVAARF